MATWLLILVIYLVLGVITNIIAICMDPIILYFWFFIPIGIIIWPWVLWVIVLFPDNTGRWI